MLVPIKGVKVHGYVLPWAVRHRKWLEEARGLVPRARSSPARVTIAYISFHISQHASPVVPVFEESVGLVPARVSSGDLIMNFLDQVGA